ncbi:MAG: FkbM family methyltransferase [Phycisphaerales bacterium]
MSDRSLFIRPIVLPVVRSILRRMQTDALHVGTFSRAWRILIMIPVMGVLVLLTRLRLLILRRPLQVQGTTFFGDRFRCHLPDLIQMYIHLFGVWEPDLTAFIERRLENDRGFIDIGANIGYFTHLAAASSEGDIVAIDASPAMHAALVNNLQANDKSDRVRAVLAAVSDHEGAINIYAGPAHNLGLTTTVEQRGFAREATINASPLGQLLEPHEIAQARLIKVDVEGGEPAVVRGMTSMIGQLPNDVEILIELSPHWWDDRSLTPLAVLQPFIDAGFRVYALDNSYWPWRYLWPRSVNPPRRVQVNTLAQSRTRMDIVLSRLDAHEL